VIIVITLLSCIDWVMTQFSSCFDQISVVEKHWLIDIMYVS